jgi:hypothetical protein
MAAETRTSYLDPGTLARLGSLHVVSKQDPRGWFCLFSAIIACHLEGLSRNLLHGGLPADDR